MINILIVDDSATIRRMVQASLRAVPGASFLEAGNGLEALERLALTKVSLIVLDLNMPDMHGLEVLTFVRGHAAYRDIPVIVLTTRGDEAGRRAALEAGATVYLTKPFVPAQIAGEALTLLGQVGLGVQH